ncbi:uncharacterized protein LOC102801266 [Saccoglossus kowalevskii]|uniref:Uncharacterized protein LOC102801266 n=1 Tax=Saccoglossus kowalevskii TaxID=10224 RepID=A0ABM0MUL4_SACKO|nr:PREDICTED: uncharacterized protein LOC102801266 [Saccoglossus kowalevskii]
MLQQGHHRQNNVLDSTSDFDSPRPARRSRHGHSTTLPHNFDPGRRRSWIPGLESGVSLFSSHSQKSVRIHGLSDDEWHSLLSAITAIFTRKKVEPADLFGLHKKIQVVLKSEISTFLGEYYKTHLIKKGMIILRDEVNKTVEKKNGIITALSQLWTEFYSTILPQLQAIFNPVQTTDLTIRQMTLVGFRDYVVLNVKVEDALLEENVVITPEVKQMMLVLQHVQDTKPPSENYLKLEEMVSRIIDPYIGTRGLYIGGRLKVNRKISTVTRPTLLQWSYSFTESNNNKPSNLRRTDSVESAKSPGSNGKVVFSIPGDSTDSEGTSENGNDDTCSGNGNGNDNANDNYNVDGMRRMNIRRGSVPILPLSRNTLTEESEEEDEMIETGFSLDDRGHVCSVSTPKQIPRRKRSTSELPDLSKFQRDFRRGSMPSVSILKNSNNNGIRASEGKGHKSRFHLRFSHRKSKTVKYL